MDWYAALRAASGPRNWWPGRTRLEIILGAILAQNTAWTNAERALRALRAEGLLNLQRLRRVPVARLAEVIRSSGAYRQKARKVRAFLDLLEADFGGSLARVARLETGPLRAWLLSVWGIGPETADSILLYAYGRPVFVVDAYTERVLRRHALIRPGAGYAEIQRFFLARLPADASLYNDYHAQLVRVGQLHCGRRPRCDGCPLEPFLPRGPRPSS